jgi:hypothetical protein
MASLQGYVTRLAYDAVKMQHSVAVRALLFNILVLQRLLQKHHSPIYV